MHTISLVVGLLVFWLLNSGHYTALLLTLGLGSTLFVVWIARRMDLVDHESQPLHMSLLLPSYWAWLLKEIIKANIDVALRVWRGPGAISPSVARLPMSQRSEIGQVIYGNSITLTPGTVAMDLEDGEVVVHALTREGIIELEKGEMDRRVRRLEGAP